MASSEQTGAEPKTGQPVLETNHLTHRFGELVAVDDLTLRVNQGEFRSIIGPNGAGKTTFFNLVSGALLPSEGSVVFAGEDVSQLPPHERVRRGIGRSFQITNVFGGLSVRENVRLAAQAVGERRSAAENVFRHKDSFDDLNGRTDDVLSRVGLATREDEQASTLSYGDRRRLEIGLVLATDPKLVMLDEPMAGMSTEETRATMDLIKDVLGDRTVLLIEHDIELVMNASDTVTVLNRGAELATGPPEAVAENEDVQQAYLGGGTL
ncbi:ABC transporter ATP-binding protein [Haloarchaeobius sp. DFWS5]|uniref:ABC transporter ATP-binding protein n=1 Tax=Haloarchaeobius sp. DFWS5 TaxID=3446114 RepID=UPI003EB6C0E8